MAVTEDQLTIDQLAQRTGMTVRNIRAHQSRGLLLPPEVRGRTGYYGEDHVARVELIKQLQADGFNLELIRRILDQSGGHTSEVVRFTRALREPFGTEEPQVVEVSELVERWQSADPAVLEKAQELGLFRPLGDGRYEELSPRLMQAGQELVELGIPVKHVLEIAARLRRHADSLAKMYVELFVRRIWKPLLEEGGSEDIWPEANQALERLRPLAAESVLAVFQLAMDDAVEEALGREMHRLERMGRRR